MSTKNPKGIKTRASAKVPNTGRGGAPRAKARPVKPRGVLAVEANVDRAERCEGVHLPACMVELMRTDPALYDAMYDDSEAAIAKICEGPIEVECRECENSFGYYLVLFEDCGLNIGHGTGKAWLSDKEIDPVFVEEFYEEKTGQLQKKLAVLRKPEKLIEMGASKILSSKPRQIGTKQLLDDELPMGAEASTSASVKKLKRRNRGGKKDGARKAHVRAASEIAGSMTSSAYASRRLRFKEMTRQIIHHKRKKKNKQVAQLSDVAGPSGT